MLTTIIIESNCIPSKIFKTFIFDAYTYKKTLIKPVIIQKQLIFHLYAITYLRIKHQSSVPEIKATFYKIVKKRKLEKNLDFASLIIRIDFITDAYPF